MLLHEFVTLGPNLRVFLSHCGVGAWPYHLHPCQLSRAFGPRSMNNNPERLEAARSK